MGKRPPRTTWVHVAEHDTDEGAVYVPEDADIPLSRRPRERLTLLPDGTAWVFEPGPDDRYVKRTTRWRDETTEHGAASAREPGELRIARRDQGRLVVRR